MGTKISYIVKDKSFEKFAMMMLLGTTADAMETESNFFFTFWGLKLLTKKHKPKVAGMPTPMNQEHSPKGGKPTLPRIGSSQYLSGQVSGRGILSK